MGASVHSGSVKRRSRRHFRPMSEINVTPLVDVMLVLLIVFMITAPLLTGGVPVDLPKVKTKTVDSKAELIMVTLNKEGRIFLQEAETNLDVINGQLKILTKEQPDAKIYIRGDKEIQYGALMTVMGKLTSGGYNKVVLITEFPQGLSQKKDSSFPKTLKQGREKTSLPNSSKSIEKFPKQ